MKKHRCFFQNTSMLSIFQKCRYIDVDIDVSPNTTKLSHVRSCSPISYRVVIASSAYSSNVRHSNRVCQAWLSHFFYRSWCIRGFPLVSCEIGNFNNVYMASKSRAAWSCPFHTVSAFNDSSLLWSLIFFVGFCFRTNHWNSSCK